MIFAIIFVSCKSAPAKLESFIANNLKTDLNKSNFYQHQLNGGHTKHNTMISGECYGIGSHILGTGEGSVGLFNGHTGGPRATIPGALGELSARRAIRQRGTCLDCHGDHHGVDNTHSPAMRGLSNRAKIDHRYGEIMTPGYAEFMERSRTGNRKDCVNAQYDVSNWNIINNNYSHRGMYGCT